MIYRLVEREEWEISENSDFSLFFYWQKVAICIIMLTVVNICHKLSKVQIILIDQFIAEKGERYAEAVAEKYAKLFSELVREAVYWP